MTSWSIHKYSTPQVKPEPARPAKNKIEPAIRIEVRPNCLVCGKEIKEKESFVAFLKDKILS